ncbi:MAG: T9SS type A sorting domain-containing protein [Prevotella sp.]|nr:T9SS type A sorting domain-containing protein [Prevotella sp.]
MVCLLLFGPGSVAYGQTVANLSLSAASVSASTELADRPVSLIKDNRYAANAKYWSSYHGDEYLGQYEYVELEWACQNVYKEVRAYWAEDGDNILLPTDAYVAWWDGSDWQHGPTLAQPDASRLSATQIALSAIKVRLYMRSDKACGLRELQLMGYADPSVSYVWPEYHPTLFYDYRSEYPALDPPTKMLPEGNNMKGYMADGWWAVAWGPKTNPHVTETAKKGLLQKMNEDFAFFRDQMGWPPDKRARNGYYSTVYVYGSGLNSDDADMYARGGWQGATWYQGSSWPMVNISYYPIACFDPAFTTDYDNPNYDNWRVTDQTFQQNACVHEGIHAIFADLEGCKNSAWYQEAGNTWLQGEAELVKSGKTPESMGYLSAGNMIAPFMPIECYSGWLLDDTFGGPSAEGVNMFGASGQICTWRNMLGGVQYGELFPHFVSEILGRGSIPWIWRYCRNRVLDGMADSLGEKQMRHLILEYRARQAMVDVGQWSNACRKLLDDNWLLTVQQEWSPYSKKVEVWKATPYANMYACDPVDSARWWRPEWRTTPGWSGANQIPLHVNAAEGNLISLHFKPLGENMVCMLCYRSKRGKIYYSQPVEGEGDVLMQLQEVPANNVVIAVVVNTDYIYKGEETRKKHFDYRLQMGENIYQPAKAQLKWYNYRSTIRDTEFISSGIDAASTAAEPSARFTIKPARTVVGRGEQVPLHIAAASQLQVPVRLYSQAGQLVYSQSFMRDGDYLIPASIAPGIYVMQGLNGRETSSVKIVVK